MSFRAWAVRPNIALVYRLSSAVSSSVLPDQVAPQFDETVIELEWQFDTTGITVRKRNNLTTSLTLLDKLPVSDLFFADNEPGIFPIETWPFTKCSLNSTSWIWKELVWSVFMHIYAFSDEIKLNSKTCYATWRKHWLRTWRMIFPYLVKCTLLYCIHSKISAYAYIQRRH